MASLLWSVASSQSPVSRYLFISPPESSHRELQSGDVDREKLLTHQQLPTSAQTLSHFLQVLTDVLIVVCAYKPTIK